MLVPTRTIQGFRQTVTTNSGADNSGRVGLRFPFYSWGY